MHSQNRAVIIILYDSQGHFLLQHRSKDAKLMPDYWAFFGGSIILEETPEEAVRREALEELNYRIRSPEFILDQDVTVGDIVIHVYVYIEAVNDQEKAGLKLGEGQGWGWYKIEQLPRLKMINHDRKIIDYICFYLKHKNKTVNIYG